MDNQHRKIDGYRELDQDTIDAMNAVKNQERDFLALLDIHMEDNGADPRWTAIAKTAIEKAAMFAGRAVARPDGYPEQAPEQAGLSEASVG